METGRFPGMPAKVGVVHAVLVLASLGLGGTVWAGEALAFLMISGFTFPIALEWSLWDGPRRTGFPIFGLGMGAVYVGILFALQLAFWGKFGPLGWILAGLTGPLAWGLFGLGYRVRLRVVQFAQSGAVSGLAVLILGLSFAYDFPIGIALALVVWFVGFSFLVDAALRRPH